MREKLGTERVSNAYEFYEAVSKHLVLTEKSYASKPKPPFEATNYLLYYFAANEQDAVGKTCHFVLDRTRMWDTTRNGIIQLVMQELGNYLLPPNNAEA